jgi:archaellum component FlaC
MFIVYLCLEAEIMSKYSNKKALISTMVAMLMVLSAFLVITGSASATASGTVTYNVTTYGLSSVSSGSGIPVTTITFVSGGTFSSGATVYFYLSTTGSPSGLLKDSSGNYYAIGSTTLTSSSPTSLNQPVTFFPNGKVIISSGSESAPSIPEGQYYILASDSSPSTVQSSLTSGTVGFAFPSSPVQFVPQSAALNIYVPYTTTEATSSNALTVGSTGLAYGTGWDAGASVSVYLNYAGSSYLLATATASSSGSFKAYFTVPQISGTVNTLGTLLTQSYSVVAQETNTLSSSYPQGGITAFNLMDVMPSITVSPISTQGAAGSSFTITGNGFVAGQVISGFSSTSTGTSSIVFYQGSLTDNVYYSTVTVGSNGYFTVTVTLAASFKASSFSPGPVDVKIVLTTPSATDEFTNAVYYSVPGISPTIVLYDEYTGGITTSTGATGYVGDPLLVLVWGFPASSSVNVYFDSSIFTFTTDANGFAQYSTSVPAVPGGSYSVFGVSNGIAAATAYPFEVLGSLTITDSAGNPLSTSSYIEYAAAGSAVTVSLTGYAPYQEFTITDTGLANQNLGLYYYYGIVSVTITNGSFDSSTMNFVANGQGVLTLTYNLKYKASTGTSETIAVSSSGTSVGSATYKAVGKASVTISSSPAAGTAPSYTQSATVTLYVSKLIPLGAKVTPETQKWVGPYSVYLNGALVTLTTGKTTFLSTSSGTASVSFVLSSSLANGVYTLTIVANSGSGKTVYTNPEFIVSTASTVPTVYVNPVMSGIISGSGTLSSPYLMYPDDDQGYYGIEFDLYGFPSTATVTMTYYTSSGATYSSVTLDTNGAAEVWFDAPSAVGNIPYMVTFTATLNGKAITITNPTYYFETVPAVAFDQTPFTDNLGSPATDYYSYTGSYLLAGTSVTVYANSLLPSTAYNIYLSTSASFNSSGYLTTFTTEVTGDGSATVTIPYTLPTGTYYLDFAQASVSSGTASLYLTIEVQQFMPAYAFPGELLTFSWPIEKTEPYPHPAGATFSGTTTSGAEYTAYYGQVYVTVLLNGTAYTTFPAAVGVGTENVYLNGSFLVPNGQPGNYFTVGLNWTQNVYFDYTVGGSPSASATEVFSGETSNYYGSPAATLTLVSGNGALLTGISSSQIATIVAAVNNAVTTSMQVPLSELNASVVAINNAVATINTAFGTMTASLSAINATVNSISNGVATVKTALGTVQTSLANLNATVLGISNNVVLLNTVVGQVQTTLNAINATLVSVNNGVMTLKTDAGTLMASVSAINATVSSINGNVATIMTNAGKVMASLNAINATLASVNGNTVTIKTSLGNVQTSLNSINATITSTASSVSSLVGSTATIQTSLGTISGTVTSINNGVATIQTSLGTLQANVSAIKTTSAATSSSVASTLGWELGVLILVIITLVLVLIVMMQVNRISKQFRSQGEKKTPEEKKEGQ